MLFKILPALDDNYMYIITDEILKETVVVDPVEPKKVLKALEEDGTKLSAILTTHHHWDHAGGNAELLQLMPGLKVYGGDAEISGLTKQVEHSDEIIIGSLKITCLLTPCHTRGHVCYYIEDTKTGGPGAVFTGDTLFQAGCGKFFEGNAEQMYNALINILGSLPSCTKVFCGHEYTANNLLFAVHVEPENTFVRERLEWAKRMKISNQPTVPSTIEEEKSFNPFMRVHESSIQKYTGEYEPVKVMECLRNKKNHFSERV